MPVSRESNILWRQATQISTSESLVNGLPTLTDMVRPPPYIIESMIQTVAETNSEPSPRNVIVLGMPCSDTFRHGIAFPDEQSNVPTSAFTSMASCKRSVLIEIVATASGACYSSTSSRVWPVLITAASQSCRRYQEEACLVASGGTD